MKVDNSNYLIRKKQLKHVIVVFVPLSIISSTTIIPQKLIKKDVTILDNEIEQLGEIFDENPQYVPWDMKLLKIQSILL